MKITYTFADGTTSIVEVSEDIGNIIIDFDRLESNADRVQRRHNCSLNAYDVDDNYLPSDEDIEADFIENEDRQALYEAIKQLKPTQQDLIIKLFFEGMSQDEYARISGTTKSTISERKKVALKKLKKILQ